MDSSLQAAHEHRTAADGYTTAGRLIDARDEYLKAAKAFEQCKSNHTSTKTTLAKACTNAAKELERRITKLQKEGKDPALPQRSDSASPDGPSRQSYVTQTALPSASMRFMDSNNNNVDESFMVLGQRSDPGDAFNKFWKIMEGMLDNLSQPVAFTTAPLGTEPNLRDIPRHGSSSSDTDRDDPLMTKLSKKLGLGSEPGWEQSLIEETEEVLADEGNDLSESFCLIPPGPGPSVSALSRENASLRQEMEEMQKRLAATERVLQLRKEQDQQLRDSIVLARQQAQRVMGTSLMVPRTTGQQPVDLNALNLNLPAAPVTALNAGREREAQHLRRIRELEEELRVVRRDNEKQKEMITRFRERWGKLKESAKRKKDAKAAAQTPKMGLGGRIEEDPEAERELDEACKRP